MSNFRRRLMMAQGGGKGISNIIYINQLESDPSKMITGDVNGDVIKWIRENSHRVLAKKTGEGEVTYCRLDDSNSNFYYDGTPSVLTSEEGDVFVKLPTFYYAGNDDGTGASGDNVEITFSINPFDGCVEWDTNALIGVYEIRRLDADGKVHSLSGLQSTFNLSQATFKSYAKNRGKGYQLVDWQMHCVMGCLYYAMYGNTNCQKEIGYGVDSNNKTNGQTDYLGMNDTNASTNGNSQSINFWGLENWWGNKFEFIENVVINDRLWEITEADGSVRELNAGDISGYISKMIFGRYLDLIPSKSNASESTGFCDYYNQNTGTGKIVERSFNNSRTNCGVAAIDANPNSSYTGNYNSSRLAFRGICIEETNVEEFKALPVL